MQRLQRLHDHQRQFVRDASHQLRTPLAVLKTQVQSALCMPATDARAALPAMHETVDRAIRLANQMLALAKVEQVQGQAEPAISDLGALANEVALDLSPLIGERNLDFELQAGPSWVHGHEWMVRELLRNLLHNAIRETPKRGELLMRVGNAELLISDSGPGIAPELRDRLFEPFHTGHPTQGSGLGLSICREICNSVGATIELANRQYAGRLAGLDATVRFRPASEPPPA
jgi:two-component system sensor histidine kinase TctE